MSEEGSIGRAVEEDDGVEMWSALEGVVTRKMKSVGGGRRGVVGVARDDRSTAAEHYEGTFESLCD